MWAPGDEQGLREPWAWTLSCGPMEVNDRFTKELEWAGPQGRQHEKALVLGTATMSDPA